MKNILQAISIIIFLALMCKGMNSRNYEKTLEYLKNHGYLLKSDGDGVLSTIDIGQRIVLKVDLQHICKLGTIRNLGFRSSTIELGAIKGLENCDKLEYIYYDENTLIQPEDILHNNVVTKLKELGFNGISINDKYLEYIAKLNLKQLTDLSIQGRFTDQGVKRFVASSGGDVSGDRVFRLSVYNEIKHADGLILSLVSPEIDDKIFDYFLQLKGLNKLYIGGVQGCQITEKASMEFSRKYRRKYGIAGVTGYLWPRECPKE